VNTLLNKILSRLFGLNECAKASDELAMKTYKVPTVFCIRCREHIYYMKSETGGACVENLVPLANNPLPASMDCPLCKQDIRAWIGDKAVLKTDRGYL
jgi:hypothetical protein